MPGLLVSLSIVAAVIATRGGEAPEWTPRVAAALDRDSIGRPLYVLAIAGALVGIAALVVAATRHVMVAGAAAAAARRVRRRLALWLLITGIALLL